MNVKYYRTWVWILALLVFLVTPGDSRSQDCIDYLSYMRMFATFDSLEHVSRFAIDENLIYMAGGYSDYRLEVGDISIPAAAEVIGGTTIPGRVSGVAVSFPWVYLTSEIAGGVLIVDVSDPANPQYTGMVNTPGDAEDIAVSGDYSYVADGVAGLQIIKLSPSPHIEVTVDTPGIARDVAIRGNYAYVADSSGFLVVRVDLFPQIVGEISGAGGSGIVVSGDFAYLCSGSLRVIDISTPEEPQVVGSHPIDSYYVDDVAIQEPYIFVGGIMLDVFDVSIPNSPQILATLTTGGGSCLATAGHHVFSNWDDSRGLLAVDFSSVEVPPVLAALELPGAGRDVFLRDGYAYVAMADSGLQILDVSDPADPQLSGAVDTPEYARSVTVTGDFALVADGLSGVQFVDISTASNPQILGAVITPSVASDVWVEGNHAFVTDGLNGSGNLHVVEMSLIPEIISSAPTHSNANAVAVKGDHAYVACGSLYDAGMRGIQVFDITDPLEPSLVGEADTWASAYEISFGDDIAWVVDALALFSFDISDPTNPVPLGQLDLVSWGSGHNFGSGVTVSGDFAYVGNETAGLHVVDIRFPEHPQYVGTVVIPGTTMSASVADGLVHMVGSSGYQVAWTQCGDVASVPGPIRSRLPLIDVYPNPFNPLTTIRYQVPASSWTSLKLFDLSGRMVRCLQSGSHRAGIFEVSWDGNDERGRRLPSGVYLCRFDCGEIVDTKRVTLLK